LRCTLDARRAGISRQFTQIFVSSPNDGTWRAVESPHTKLGGSMSLKTAALSVALGLGAIVLPSIGSARVYLDVDIAPPAPRVEVVPAPRVGYVWAPGYWNYEGRHHVWVKGHYIRGHRGHHWVADSWEQRGNRWHRVEGHWD
jgi:hypothetical protein